MRASLVTCKETRESETFEDLPSSFGMVHPRLKTQGARSDMSQWVFAITIALPIKNVQLR